MEVIDSVSIRHSRRATNNNKKFRSFKSKENIHKIEVWYKPTYHISYNFTCAPNEGTDQSASPDQPTLCT